MPLFAGIRVTWRTVTHSAIPPLTRARRRLDSTGDRGLLIWFGYWDLPPRSPPRWPRSSWSLNTHPMPWPSIISFNPLYNPRSSLENRLGEGENLSLGHTAMHGRARILVLTRTLVESGPRRQAKQQPGRWDKNWQETLRNKTFYTHRDIFYYLLINLITKGPLWSSEHFIGTDIIVS